MHYEVSPHANWGLVRTLPQALSFPHPSPDIFTGSNVVDPLLPAQTECAGRPPFFSLLTPLPNASAQERAPSGVDKADKCGAFTCAGTSPAFFFPSFTTPPGLK